MCLEKGFEAVRPWVRISEPPHSAWARKMRLSGLRSTVVTISPCWRSCTRRIWSPPTRRLDGCSHASAVAPPLCGRIRSTWHVPSSTTCRTAKGRGPILSTRQMTLRVRRPMSPEATYGGWARAAEGGAEAGSCARCRPQCADAGRPPLPAAARSGFAAVVTPCCASVCT
jgi:hypothetical protein